MTRPMQKYMEQISFFNSNKYIFITQYSMISSEKQRNTRKICGNSDSAPYQQQKRAVLNKKRIENIHGRKLRKSRRGVVKPISKA
jgi:hypothetical protein